MKDRVELHQNQVDVYMDKLEHLDNFVRSHASRVGSSIRSGTSIGESLNGNV